MPPKKHKFFFNNLSTPHKVLTIAGIIVVAGFFFPPNDPWTFQIFNAITDPIIASVTADIAPIIGVEAEDCIEVQGGSYNYQTFKCDLP